MLSTDFPDYPTLPAVSLNPRNLRNLRTSLIPTGLRSPPRVSGPEPRPQPSTGLPVPVMAAPDYLESVYQVILNPQLSTMPSAFRLLTSDF